VAFARGTFLKASGFLPKQSWEIAMANPPSKPDIPPPIREREVETPVELPDPNRETPPSPSTKD
jgi:hypothetical protein